MPSIFINIIVHIFSIFVLIYSIECQSLNGIIEQQPIFTLQPFDVGPLFSGARGIVQCTASGTPAVSYRWMKNEQFITNKSVTNGGVYLISQADRLNDVGIYQCVAENSLGSVLSNKAFLSVAYMDQLKTSYPVEIRVRHGRAAMIKMPKMFDGYPTPAIEWFAGGALIEPNAKFAITKDFDLVILRSDKADEKSYYVEASSIHTGIKIRSKEIRLIVTDGSSIDENYGSNDEDSTDDQQTDLEFIVKPVDTVAKLNDNLVKFDCIVNSRRVPLDQLEINWFKDNQLIDFIKTKYHLSARSLEIISVTDQDAGIYTCLVKHSYMSFSNNNSPEEQLDKKLTHLNASAKLDVYIKPTFKIQPENLIETDYGKTVQLKCEGISNPPANITWYKNAHLIDISNQTNIQLNESNTKLIINNISKNDQAIYQCFLSNEAGHISASTLIKIISFSPKFTESIKNKTVYSDSNAFLSCGQVESSPRPKITWIKLNPYNADSATVIGSNFRETNSNELNNNENINRYFNLDETNSNYYINSQRELDFSFNSLSNGYYVNMNGDLIIKNVNIKNQGWYRCEASNILGTITANIFLQVKKKTEIIEPPMNISVTKGQSALFKCTISKEEDVDIELKWTFNDLPLDLIPSNQYSQSSQLQNSNLKLYPNGTLLILEAKNTDIGIYKCLVNSVSTEQAGNDSKIAYLNVVELPYSPYNVQSDLNLNEKRSVNLTWQSSFDGNSQIIKYIVQARITTSFDLLMLQQQQQQYEQSPLIPSLSMQTFDWFVIKDNIYESVISTSFSSSLLTSSQTQQQQQQTHWTIINDLRPAISYEFRVSAVNGIGEGMPSKPSKNITIPEEEPSQAPQNLQAEFIGSKFISLKWQLPVLQSWNGRLKGYKIAYSLSYPNSTWKYVSVNDPAQTSTNLTDLIVWEIYLVKICAFNSKGDGKYSDFPIKIRTKEGIPIRAPLNFRANSFNSTCIKMAWSEPPAQFVNGIIQGYKLIYYKDNHLEAKSTYLIDINSIKHLNQYQTEFMQENQHNYQLCNLSKFTKYTFSILCFTNSGDGPATQPIQLQTLEDIPGEINEIYFNNVYDTSLEMEWKPPLQPNGRILQYIISYRPVLSMTTSINKSSNKSSSNSQPKFEHIILDASQNNFTIKNLKPSTEYLIGIRAKTLAGEGQTKLTQIKSGVPPELPEPPKAIVIRTIGNTFVELEFIPGFNGKTSISKWIVEALVVLNNDDFMNYVQALSGNSIGTSGLKWIRIYEKSNSPNATKLKVENLSPFTNYTLRMFSQNVKGISKPSVPTELFQTLAGVPSLTPMYLGARLNGLFKNSNNDSSINVLLKWTPIPTNKWNGIPLGYVVLIETCDSKISYKIEIKFDSLKKNSFVLRNLKSHECYKIRICAWNNVGLGPWTPDSNLLIINRTSESKPWRGPQNVNLYSVNSTCMKIIWSKLDSKYTNGILIGYKVKYMPELDENSQNLIDEKNPNDFFLEYANELASVPSYSITNFKPKYLFFNIKDAKSSLSSIFYSDYEENLNDLYEVGYFGSDSTHNNSVEIIYLNNLLSFTNYKIEISGCTKAGCGVYSSPVSLRTSEFIPSKPINLNFPYVNLTSLQLEWHNPIKPNGILKFFRIRYMLKRQSNFNQPESQWSVIYYTINQTSETKHLIKLNGLSKMEYYLFEISANNTSGLGWGEPAYTLVYTIDRRNRPDPPSQPVVSKSSIKPNEVTLSWNSGAENYSPIRYFTIEMKEISSKDPGIIKESDWKTIVNKYFIDSNAKADSYSLKIGGKDRNGSFIIKSNGRLLKFRVSATNDVGTSDLSAESDQIKTKFNYPRQKPLNLNAIPISVNRIMIQWLEKFNSNDSFESDYLIKYKIIYKLIMVSSIVCQDSLFNCNQIELIVDYKATKRQLVNSTLIQHEYFLENQIFLANGTYEIKVCGINQIGEGECSYTNQALTYMEDTVPVLFDKKMMDSVDENTDFPNGLISSVTTLSSTEVNITWLQPNIKMINGKLYGYKIVCIKDDILELDYSDLIKNKNLLSYTQQSNEVLEFSNRKKRAASNVMTDQNYINEIIVEPDSNYVIINSLKPFTKYSIYIQLINQGGESVAPFFFLISKNDFSNRTNQIKKFLSSQLKSAKTFESVPSNPSRIIFSYVSYTYLNVTWLKPRQPNGEILSYEIWYENLPKRMSTTTTANLTNPDIDLKTKIIRQEIKSNLNSSSFTLYVNNLEPNTEYKFKVRCRTSVDWGPYVENSIRTGPQFKLMNKNINHRNLAIEEINDQIDENTLYQMGSPLSPSRPLYTEINSSHSMLEWKTSSENYERFIIEIKYFLHAPLNTGSGYSSVDLLNNYILLDEHQMIKTTSTFSYEKNTNRNSSINTNFEFFAYSNQTILIINKNSQLNNSPLFVFRVFAFNFVGISEPSPNSDLIHNRIAEGSSKFDESYFNSHFNNVQSIYSNWWFLVIIALASFTLLVVVILIMFLRGKNKKFLLNKRKKRMNTMKMIHMNSINKSDLKHGSTSTNIHLINNTNTMSQHNKQQDTNILLENLGNNEINEFSNENLGYNQTLPTNSGGGYLANRSMPTNGQLILDVNTNNLSKNALYELRKSQRAKTQSNTLRTATYASQNMKTNCNDNRFTNNFDENNFDATSQNTLGKINHRNLNSLLNGFFTPNAQPNDYCSSGNIGAMISNNNISNYTLKSNKNNNHYLIPTNNNDFLLEDQAKFQDVKDHKTKAQFYYGLQNYSSMKLKDGDSIPIIRNDLTHTEPVQNFYTIEDENSNKQIIQNEASSVIYDRNATNNLSNRKVFTTSSFGSNNKREENFNRIPIINSFEERRDTNTNTINQTYNYRNNNQNNKSLCMNTYYEHQQLYQQKQPTYSVDMSYSITDKEQKFPSPSALAKSSTPAISSKIVSSELVDNTDLSVNTTKLITSTSPNDLPNKNNKNISSISISLTSGDRLIMNNTAGSRKPLTGFSS